MKLTTFLTVLVAALAVLLAGGTSAMGAFSVGYSDGGSWNSIFAQGFSPSVQPNPDPGLAPGDGVTMTQFQFFKSGNADNTSDIRLAIISPFFSNTINMMTTSPYVVGLSDNTINGTAGIATGDPIMFTFGSGLPLTYGNGYAAVFVNVSGTSLIPVLVPALVADYIESPPMSGIYVPESNYGTDTQYDYAVSNFQTTTPLPPPGERYFNTFSYAADANFRATFVPVVPEPATLVLGVCSLGLLATGLRRSRS